MIKKLMILPKIDSVPFSVFKSFCQQRRWVKLLEWHVRGNIQKKYFFQVDFPQYPCLPFLWISGSPHLGRLIEAFVSSSITPVSFRWKNLLRINWVSSLQKCSCSLHLITPDRPPYLLRFSGSSSSSSSSSMKIPKPTQTNWRVETSD